MPGEAAQAEAKQQVDVAGPVLGDTGFAAPSSTSPGTRSHEHAILRLQETAGNRAVSEMLHGVQRAPAGSGAPGAPLAPKSIFDDYATPSDPIAQAILNRPLPAQPKPAEPPKPAHGRRRDGITALTGGTDTGDAPIGTEDPSAMSYSQALDEIAALDGWMAKRQESTRESVQVEIRLHKLVGRITELLTPAKPRKGRRGPAARKPRTLTEKLDLLRMRQTEMATELDAIVEYLRGTPKRGEIRRLAETAVYLEQKLGEARDTQSESVRQTDMSLALNVSHANVYYQLEETIRRFERIRPHPAAAEISLLPHGKAKIPVMMAEVEALRGAFRREIAEYIAATDELLESAWKAYQDRVDRNEEHPRVHYLVRVYGGIDDLDRSETASRVGRARIEKHEASAHLSKGRLSAGFRSANTFSIQTDAFADLIGKWEGSLLRGAGRWVLALTVLKEGLTFLATGGASAITAMRIARGAGVIRTTLGMAGTLGGTAAVAGFGGSLVSQAGSKDGISIRKAGKAAGIAGIEGGTIGLSAGTAAGFKNALGAGETVTGLSRTSRFLRTGAAEIGSGSLIQGGAALVKGDSVPDALIGAGIGGVMTGGLAHFSRGEGGPSRVSAAPSSAARRTT